MGFPQRYLTQETKQPAPPPRRCLSSKLNRATVETSQAIRRVPFLLPKWKEFSKQIERTVEELTNLESELHRIESRAGVNAQLSAHSPFKPS